MTPRLRTAIVPRIAVIAILAASLCGQAGAAAARSKHWYTPWRKAEVAAPVLVVELPVESTDGSAAPTLPQYWDRNTLRVDLGQLPGSGTLRLLPSAVNGWPLRIVFAARPGSFRQLEVSGDKRVVFNIASDGSEAVVLALGSNAYTAATKALTLRWE